jgi:hypothetical protein
MGLKWHANMDLIEKPERDNFHDLGIDDRIIQDHLLYLSTIVCHFLPIPNQISYQIQTTSPARNSSSYVKPFPLGAKKIQAG